MIRDAWLKIPRDNWHWWFSVDTLPQGIPCSPATPRYAVGDTVYVSSRFEGIIQCSIASILLQETAWYYELSEPVVVHKDGHAIGSAEVETGEVVTIPAHQNLLMKMGDRILDAYWEEGRSQTCITLSEDMVAASQPVQLS